MAKKYLSRNNWRLNYALNEYYDKEIGSFIGDDDDDDGCKTILPDLNKYPQELIALFKKYSSKNNDSLYEFIDVDGLINYINDLKYNLEDLVTICLAKLLHCENLKDGINKQQFLSNWYLQGCSTLEQMQHVLNDLDVKLHQDASYFTQIYNYTFDLIIDVDDGDSTRNNTNIGDDTTNSNDTSIVIVPRMKDNNLDVETAIAYWKVFFNVNEQYPVKVNKELLSLWFQFLNEERKKEITKDQWQMLLEFFKKFSNLEMMKQNYDETAAWPYMIDEFYEYLQDTGRI
ncbi:NEDD8 ligase DCN1 NDAI_0G02590 [Naumovozyma dairenensis CBS 421]|uniref:Defective in cullin neddylation protein n=1 Tax=Naumovozyma dairenensis (strain ATCC 10597 / BCRC 20456 / CBS 421 / NBRC 0211 / NRRL Y-12639) TaxID=1071378 RepID=G0WE25_NAUDC|nr:hypothetical protein NDAI_0G02590 [Naumovozyma dairenensis CBS 421]CCD26036.2 hypothetical protein NDAI_0G02590 [Naumovozyma dairenensis CBS 421]